MMMWLCVLAATALLGAGTWGGMKLYGHWAMKRDEEERERLAAEWKRRAEERKTRGQGTTAAPDEESGEHPPLY